MSVLSEAVSRNLDKLQWKKVKTSVNRDIDEYAKPPQTPNRVDFYDLIDGDGAVLACARHEFWRYPNEELHHRTTVEMDAENRVHYEKKPQELTKSLN